VMLARVLVTTMKIVVVADHLESPP
jgi:hypothetical protein